MLETVQPLRLNCEDHGSMQSWARLTWKDNIGWRVEGPGRVVRLSSFCFCRFVWVCVGASPKSHEIREMESGESSDTISDPYFLAPSNKGPLGPVCSIWLDAGLPSAVNPNPFRVAKRQNEHSEREGGDPSIQRNRRGEDAEGY